MPARHLAFPNIRGSALLLSGRAISLALNFVVQVVTIRYLSKLDFGGAGRGMIKHRMKQLGICGLPELVELAGELGVEITACEMSMSLMGIHEEDLIDYPHLEVAGVASFLDSAARSATNLFV